jgi:hypothetical protein
MAISVCGEFHGDAVCRGMRLGDEALAGQPRSSAVTAASRSVSGIHVARVWPSRTLDVPTTQ